MNCSKVTRSRHENQAAGHPHNQYIDTFTLMNQPVSPTSEDTQQAIESATQQGIARYFDECRRRVPDFCQQNFSYPGAWHTNKVAFGWDLLKMPINLIWAPIFVVLQLLAYLAGKCCLPRLRKYLRRLPGGFTTQVQKDTLQKVRAEVLGLKPDSNALEDALIHELTTLYIAQNSQDFDTTSQTLSTRQHQAIQEQLNTRLHPILEQALAQYAITRTASADITNTALSTAAGAIFLKKFTPGGLGFGIIIAALWARHSRTENFWLGETAGSYYYTLFPPTPSTGLIIGSTLVVMLVLAILASFSGLISDPIQQAIGLHKRRLNKFIRHLEDDFSLSSPTSYKPKDQYVARIMDTFDAVKSQLL